MQSEQYRTMNPFAAQAINGCPPASVRGYVDRWGSYVYTVALTALQVLNNEAQIINQDSDFMWRGLVFSSTGAFDVRFYDAVGYAMMNARVSSANLANDGSRPYTVFPEQPFPGGGRIGIEIADTSNAANTVELNFLGVRRYAVR